MLAPKYASFCRTCGPWTVKLMQRAESLWSLLFYKRIDHRSTPASRRAITGIVSAQVSYSTNRTRGSSDSQNLLGFLAPSRKLTEGRLGEKSGSRLRAAANSRDCNLKEHMIASRFHLLAKFHTAGFAQGLVVRRVAKCHTNCPPQSANNGEAINATIRPLLCPIGGRRGPLISASYRFPSHAR